MSSYVVVGASRGIGLGFVKQLSERPDGTVFALVRDKTGATALQDFARSTRNVTVIQADIDNLSSLKAAAAKVSEMTGGKLDILINNGALMRHERSSLTLGQFPSDEVLEQDLMAFFKTNVIGVTHTINAFLPLLRAGATKKVFVISTGLGSTKYTLEKGYEPSLGYSISKAALNMAVVKFAVTYRDVLFLAVTPGFVRTMQGTEEEVNAVYERINAQFKEKDSTWPGDISVEESVRDQLKLFDTVTLKKSGQFVRRDGADGNLGEFRL